MRKFYCYLTAILLALFGFSVLTQTSAIWMWRYSYLEDLRRSAERFPQFDPHNDYFLVVLVDARHADYSSPYGYLSTLTKSIMTEQAPDPGHAWIILCGQKDNKPWVVEGGHSVDCNRLTRLYASDMLGLSRPDSDPNPARFLFKTTEIGFFEYGSGDNRPTFAAAFPLTKEGFDRVERLFDKDGYDFSQWGIRGPNCVQFALTCLASIGINLECQDNLPLPPSLFGNFLKLWSDPSYSLLPIKSPDLLEKRLWELVRTGKAYCATNWYKSFRSGCEKGQLTPDEISNHPRENSLKT